MAQVADERPNRRHNNDKTAPRDGKVWPTTNKTCTKITIVLHAVTCAALLGHLLVCLVAPASATAVAIASKNNDDNGILAVSPRVTGRNDITTTLVINYHAQQQHLLRKRRRLQDAEASKGRDDTATATDGTTWMLLAVEPSSSSAVATRRQNNNNNRGRALDSNAYHYDDGNDDNDDDKIQDDIRTSSFTLRPYYYAVTTPSVSESTEDVLQLTSTSSAEQFVAFLTSSPPPTTPFSTSCLENEFACATTIGGSDETLSAAVNNVICLDQSRVCDRKPDCPVYGDDEEPELCQSRPCPVSSFKCNDGYCVPAAKVCDYVQDCIDGSDERNCTYKPCMHMEWQCKNKQCVELAALCDAEAHPDCLDGSDEQHCAKEDILSCDNGTKQIHRSFWCDGHPQCNDLSDEMNCGKCGEHTRRGAEPNTASGGGVGNENAQEFFQCSNTRCIPMSHVCDSVCDCGTLCEDERSSMCSEYYLGLPGLSVCRPGYSIPCNRERDISLRCIRAEFICDGRNDCEDGSPSRDEDGCVTTTSSLVRAALQATKSKATDFALIFTPTTVATKSLLPTSSHVSLPVQKQPKKSPSQTSPTSSPPVFNADFSLPVPYVNVDIITNKTDQQTENFPQQQQRTSALNLHQVCSPLTPSIQKFQKSSSSSSAPAAVAVIQCADGRAIPAQPTRCDAVSHCLDGEDERNCTFAACRADGGGSRQWRCLSGQCVPHSARCNGTFECRDRSDEIDCMDEPCPDITHRKCPKTGQCILYSKWCDFVPDCALGEDESDEACVRRQCRTFTRASATVGGFQSFTSASIESDESVAQGRTTDSSSTFVGDEEEEEEFRCNNGQCIRAKLRCLIRSREEELREPGCLDASHLVGCATFQCPAPAAAPPKALPNSTLFVPASNSTSIQTSTEISTTANSNNNNGISQAVYLKCRSGPCYHVSRACDGTPDCLLYRGTIRFGLSYTDERSNCAFACSQQAAIAHALQMASNNNSRLPRQTSPTTTLLSTPSQNLLLPCHCRDVKFLCDNRSLDFLPSDIERGISHYHLANNRITTRALVDAAACIRARPNADRPSVTTLDLRGNLLHELPANVLSDITHGAALIIHLESNRIRAIRERAFDGLSSLAALHLYGNQIERVETGAFLSLAALQQLDLSYQNLTFLPSGAFEGLRGLLSLNLSNNPKLVGFDQRAFVGLSNLKWLDLRGGPTSEALRNDVAETILKPLPRDCTLYASDATFCCYYASQFDNCYPKVDPLSSCNHLLRAWFLRVSIWCMGVVALLANTAVVMLRMRELLAHARLRRGEASTSVQTCTRFVHAAFIVSLASADVLMGAYLLIIGYADVHYRGVYYQHHSEWRHSLACKVAGFLAMLSSEQSMLTLFAMTLDRLFAIVFPLNRKVSMTSKSIKYVMVALWSVSGAMAAMPLMPIKYFQEGFYARSAVCLPLHVTPDKAGGWEYAVIVYVVINSTVSLTICAAYAIMYWVAVRSALAMGSALHAQVRQESAFAKRMLYIVATSVACVLPISTLGILSLCGVFISEEIYAWAAVFMLPLNAALNPILYTLSTRHFQQKLRRHLQRHSTMSATIHSLLRASVSTSTAGSSAMPSTSMISPVKASANRSTATSITRQISGNQSEANIPLLRRVSSARQSSSHYHGVPPPPPPMRKSHAHANGSSSSSYTNGHTAHRTLSQQRSTDFFSALARTNSYTHSTIQATSKRSGTIPILLQQDTEQGKRGTKKTSSKNKKTKKKDDPGGEVGEANGSTRHRNGTTTKNASHDSDDLLDDHLEEANNNKSNNVCNQIPVVIVTEN